MARISKSQAKSIISAIDRYIRKSDEEEEEELQEMGFPEAAATVAIISGLEEKIAEAIDNQSSRFCVALADYESLEAYIREGLSDFISDDVIQDEVRDILSEYSSDMLEKFTMAYLIEAGMEWVGEYTNRTVDAVQHWVEDTAQYFAESSFGQLRKILENGVKAGKGVDTIAREILSEGIRDTYFQARRVAQTEVLRMHSYAAFEAMVQDPDTEMKEWHHTGAHKNRPRPNHVAMSGTTVPKMERFELHGADGCIYRPMYPRDSCLPASESVNCKCIIRTQIGNPDMTLDTEEKKKRQREAIEADNQRWEEERNNPPGTETEGMLEWVKGLSKEDQQDYFGGGYSGRQRWALIESGVIDTDDKFQQLYKTNDKGVRSRKSLNELADDGIITVPRKALEHSVRGEYKAASKQWPSGRLISGGHSQAALKECDRRGIEYQITETLENGVRIGNVPSSKTKRKRDQGGQTWFPENWTEDDILTAGTYIANSASDSEIDYGCTGEFRGVRIRTLFSNGEISSIFPLYNQEEA